MEYFFPLFLAFVFSAVGTKTLIRFEELLPWFLKKPSLDRWHTTPTPSLGGVSMYLSFTTFSLLLFPLPETMLKVQIGGSMIFLLGLVDDIRPLRPYMKLVGQIMVACIMVFLDIRFVFTDNPLLYIPLTILWIVGITNAFNLLDNMNGLAGGVALIAAFFLFLLGKDDIYSISPEILALLFGAILGFLIFNFPKGKIFMGDCGSLWLGFLLSTFGIMGTWQSASNIGLVLLSPALVLAVPIFDTTLVALNRKIHGRPISQGGRDHSSHRMIALGLNEKNSVLSLWGLSILFGLLAIFSRFYKLETFAVVGLTVLAFALILGMSLAGVKVYTDTDTKGKRKKRFFPSDLFYRRKSVEILIDTLLIGAAYILAYLLRYDWVLNPYLLQQLGETLPIVMAIKLGCLVVFGFYAGVWNYINFDGMVRLFRINILASLASVLLILGLYRFLGFSRTLFLIDFVLLFALMAGARAVLRGIRESVFAFPESGLRLLVIGADDSAEYLLREIRKNRPWGIRPIGVVDSSGRSIGPSFVGVPVFSKYEEIEKLVERNEVDRVVIAKVPERTADQIYLRDLLTEANIPFYEMQSLEETLIEKLKSAKSA